MSISLNQNTSSPPASVSSIEENMVREAQKDIKAFEKLYDKYYEAIFRFIYQRVSAKEEAFDITSQTFMKAMTNIDKYKFKGFPFSSWLYRIASNELNDYFRANKKSPTLNVNEENLAQITEDFDNQTSSANQEELIKILADLTDEELPFIEMKYFEQRSFKEIGEILGITENNAKVKTHRIIKRIQSNL